MVSMSAKRQKREERNKKEGFQELSKTKVPESSVKKDLKRSSLKELASDNLTRVMGARPIGSGTFGNCYQGTYRGIAVVIKEYKEIRNARDRNHGLSLLQREDKHEAHVLQQLGDHPGIPLLFGVCLKEKPVSIVLKFHGDGGKSLTIFKAAKNKQIEDQKTWNSILFKTTEALEHIHKCGFAHNDLKANNVVLENREDGRPHPVIIDFGKSIDFQTQKLPFRNQVI